MMIYLTTFDPIAGWRDSNQDFNSGGETLEVEEFSHWVYVYSWGTTEKSEVEEDPTYGVSGQKFVEVEYTGDNLYYDIHSNWWPSRHTDYTQETHLPWVPAYTTNTVYQAWTTTSATRSEYYAYSYD